MQRGERWIIAAATVAMLVAALPVLRPGANPLLSDHDMPHYATILVSAEDGVDFARDPIFAGRAALVWRAAAGYMALFKSAYVAARGDFGIAIVLLQLVLLVIYFPSMVLFLRSVGATLPIAIGVGALSTVSSSFLVTGTRWGILTPPVPLVMCTALAPLIALIGRRHPILGATVLCVPLLLVNPATGLALIELAAILVLIAAAKRKLSLWVLVPMVVCVVVARLNIGAGSAAFSFADAAEMIRYGQDNVMVYPFRGATASRAIGAVLALHAMLSVILIALRSRRGFLAALIVLQALYAAFFLSAGWLVLLPLAVAIDAIRRDQFEEIDRWLWCALGIAIAIGPLQQVALLAIWQWTKAISLTPLVFEGARFLQFSYLILYALLARAISSLWPRLDRARAMISLAFGAGVAGVILLALYRLDIVSLRVPLAVGACAALVVFAFGESKGEPRAFAAACAFAALVGGPWMLLLLREPVRSRSGVQHDSLAFALKLPRAERNRPPQPAPCQADFARMTAYARTQTLPTALFHLTTFDRSFRPYARRAMLPVSDEWLIPIYDGAPVGRLRQETAALWNVRNDLAATRALAVQFGADYVVACEQGRYNVYSLK